VATSHWPVSPSQLHHGRSRAAAVSPAGSGRLPRPNDTRAMINGTRRSRTSTGTGAPESVPPPVTAHDGANRIQIRGRTQAGLIAARARGRTGGRKPKMAPALINKAQRMYNARQFAMAESAQSCDVTLMTIYRHITTGDSATTPEQDAAWCTRLLTSRWSTVLCTRRRFRTIPVQTTSENDSGCLRSGACQLQGTGTAEAFSVRAAAQLASFERESSPGGAYCECAGPGLLDPSVMRGGFRLPGPGRPWGSARSWWRRRGERAA